MERPSVVGLALLLINQRGIVYVDTTIIIWTDRSYVLVPFLSKCQASHVCSWPSAVVQPELAWLFPAFRCIKFLLDKLPLSSNLVQTHEFKTLGQPTSVSSCTHSEWILRIVLVDRGSRRQCNIPPEYTREIDLGKGMFFWPRILCLFALVPGNRIISKA